MHIYHIISSYLIPNILNNKIISLIGYISRGLNEDHTVLLTSNWTESSVQSFIFIFIFLSYHI